MSKAPKLNEEQLAKLNQINRELVAEQNKLILLETGVNAITTRILKEAGADPNKKYNINEKGELKEV